MEWISVKDRLPEFGLDVLVSGKDKLRYDKFAHHVCCMDDLEDGIDFAETGDFMWLTEKGTKITDVTHWMPLPPNPKD